MFNHPSLYSCSTIDKIVLPWCEEFWNFDFMGPEIIEGVSSVCETHCLMSREFLFSWLNVLLLFMLLLLLITFRISKTIISLPYLWLKLSMIPKGTSLVNNFSKWVMKKYIFRSILITPYRTIRQLWNWSYSGSSDHWAWSIWVRVNLVQYYEDLWSAEPSQPCAQVPSPPPSWAQWPHG